MLLAKNEFVLEIWLTGPAVERNGDGGFFLSPPVGLTDVVRVVGGRVRPSTSLHFDFLGFLVRRLLSVGRGRWGSTLGNGEAESLEVVSNMSAARKLRVGLHSGVQSRANRTSVVSLRGSQHSRTLAGGAVLGFPEGRL